MAEFDSRYIRSLLDLVTHELSLYSLVLLELLQSQCFTATRCCHTRGQVHQAVILNVLADASVLQDNRTKNGVEKEKLLSQISSHLLTTLVEDVTTPHTKDFPAAEFVKERFPSDFLIVVTLNKPVGQGDVVRRLIILICGDTLAGESIELIKFMGMEL